MSVFDIIALPFNNKPHIILAIIHRSESLTLDSRELLLKIRSKCRSISGA